MFEFPYKIVIIKKDEHKPVRLNKITEEEKPIHYLGELNTKINIILFILLLILFIILCYMIVPQTYGTLWY